MKTSKSEAKRKESAAIGARMKRVRKEAGLSLDDIADRMNREYGANTNKGMISKYENGIHEPSASTLFCFGRILGVSSDYLLGKTDSPDGSRPKQGMEAEGYVIRVYTRYNLKDGGDTDRRSTEFIPKSWMKGGREFFGIKIRTGIYAPRFFDGDLIIFEHRSKASRDQIALVSVAGEDAFLCRVDRKREGKLIIPLDPSRESHYYSTEESGKLPVKIIGTAVQIRRMEYDIEEV